MIDGPRAVRMTAIGTLSRRLVVASTLAAVAAGLWPLAGRPAVLAGLLAVFAASAAGGRWRLDVAAPAVLVFAYISYGVVRLLADPFVAAMPFWLAAFTGLSLGSAPWRRWQAGGGWRVPLAWWASVVAISWPFAAWRELAGEPAASLAAGPVITTALIQMSLAVWIDTLLAPAAVDEPRRAPTVVDEPRRATAVDGPRRTSRAGVPWGGALLASAVVTAAAAVYQRIGDPAWLSGEPWVSSARSVGMMGDANPMSVATALWAGLVWTRVGRGPGGLAIGAAATLLLWSAAWLSGSRTTIILMMAGAGAVLAVLARRLGPGRRTIAAITMAAIVFASAAMVIAVGRAAPGTPLGRLVATLPLSSPGAAVYELFWRRDGYGLAAVEAIKEHPVAGVGVGRFTAMAPAYYVRLTGLTIPPDNAQNFWRHTLAEQGVLGLLPILWLTVLTGRALVSRPAGSGAVVMRAMLAGLGVALLFGYPVQDAAIAVTVGTLVAAVARNA